jgi:hypothetical protein
MGRKKKQDIIVIEEKGEKVIEEKKIEEKGKLCSLNKLIRAFFYDTNRKQLSRTATMNFVFFTCAVVLFIVALIMGCMGKSLPNNIFSYIGLLTGGGFIQYSYAKTIAPNIPPNTNTTTNTTNQQKGVQ